MLMEEEKQEIVQVKHEEALELAKNLNFLAGLVLGDSFAYNFPLIYCQIFDYLKELLHKERDFTKFALGLPRGFAKTTLMKILTLYSILYTSKRIHVLVYETQSKAEDSLSDIADFLDDMNIKAIFGDWRAGMIKDTQKEKVFSFRGRNIAIKTAGSMTSVRGLNLKNERPEFILMEDVQSRESANSKELSEQLQVWLTGTLYKTKSPRGCLYLFVANMYPTPNSILRKYKNNPEWKKLIVGGVLADKTSLWEELHPIKQLMAEYASDLADGHPEIFAAEVLNDEKLLLNQRIQLHLVPEYPYPEDALEEGNFIIVDPSNDKKRSDECAITYFGIHDGKPCAKEILHGRYNPEQIIRNALSLALKRNCGLVVFESVAFQYSLNFWFNKICEQLGIQGILAAPIYPQGGKNPRILKMFTELEKGNILLAPATRLVVFDQATNFDHSRTDNQDDILDTLTYPYKVMDEYRGQVFGRNLSRIIEVAHVEEDNTPF